jgi:hypothetical protein
MLAWRGERRHANFFVPWLEELMALFPWHFHSRPSRDAAQSGRAGSPHAHGLRARALATCFAIAPIVLFAASSCSSADDSGNTISSDGSVGSPDGSGGSDAVASSCVPGDVSSFTGGAYHPPLGARQGKCDDDLLAAYIDCKENTNPVSCNMFASGDGATCLSCIETKQTDANWGPIVYDVSGMNAFPNLPGCLALAFGEGQSTTGCGATYQASLNCQDLACQTNCSSGDAATTNLTDLATCEKAALLGGCKSFADAKTVACSEDAGGADAICYQQTAEDGGASEDIWSYIARLDSYFCGDPIVDGGTANDGG